jgi:adenylate kinase
MIFVGSRPPEGELANRLRSLNLEHVSPAGLMQQEISRHTPLGHKASRALQTGHDLAEITLAIMRRWFWARKPDAGFVLTDFPATLLQALVFDEWLDARDESLDEVIALDESAVSAVLEHYRAQGLSHDFTPVP